MSNAAGYDLPDKLYFRIGEVSDIVGVKPYVLRYWETEFADLKPSKSKSKQRLYKRRDVELLLKVKELLYKERFTINGAKQRLKELARSDAPIVTESPKKHEAAKEKDDQSEAKSGSEKKFLKKIKADLEWCLSEIRA